LPAARRQVRIRQRTRNKYLDNLYQEYGVCSELDGTAAHPADEQWRDKRRDNANLVDGIVTLRFGFADLGDRRCQTAADVAAVLRRRGWTGVAYPCSRPACALRHAVS
jgi:very-short-patch-repair endonuclease